MASFVKKTFLLVVSLTCFLWQSRVAGYILVPGIPVPPNTPTPLRLEIRNFCEDETRLNILYLGWSSMQATPTNQLLSFYRISGIHGTNYTWDGDTGGNYSAIYGYCRHADKLFPTWHRPYVSLFEKTLLDLATQIVQKFPEGYKEQALSFAADVETSLLGLGDGS